jgi:C_GCAxxG_C_C family probable redox protein
MMKMDSIKSTSTKLKAKRTFMKKGTCSRTFFYILDREFGHPHEEEERAIDPLAGGVLQQGYQCGMVWGAAMAIGAESFRRNDNPDQATAITILATRHMMESFRNRAGSIECEDITSCDMTNKKGLAKFFFKGTFVTCFKLAGKWAPEAIKAAGEGLAEETTENPQQMLSCASEVVRKMGATDEEMAMVAGFAGGLGLSGSGCGALAAAIWMNTLHWNRNQTGKSVKMNPNTETILGAFYKETDYKMECSEICGKSFRTTEDHTDFIRNGGCKKLMVTLAES